MSIPEVETVLEWHDALNAGDADRLVDLSHPDVEVGGPRGGGRGEALLREWVERANVRLRPGRVYASGGAVVVEQEAVWMTADEGRPSDSQTVASVFRVADGRVVAVIRHGTLEEALEAAGLDGSDEV